MKQLATLLFFITFWSQSMQAQTPEKSINYSNQQWIQYYNKLHFSEHWSLLTDGGFRTKDAFNSPSQYIVRTGIAYQLNPNLRFAAGFAHLGFYRSDSLSSMEFRPYQEVLLKQKVGKVSIGHRFRLEQRVFRNLDPAGGLSSTGDFNLRYRYRLFLNIPLWISKNTAGRKLQLNVGDEIFLASGKDVVYNIFNQNRILVGPTFKINKNFGISMTYNHQFIGKNAPAEYNQDYVFWLGIKHTIDLRKKKGGNGLGNSDGTGGGKQDGSGGGTGRGK